MRNRANEESRREQERADVMSDSRCLCAQGTIGTTTEDIPEFDRTHVSLDIPPPAFGNGFTLITNISKILSTIILVSQGRPCVQSAPIWSDTIFIDTVVFVVPVNNARFSSDSCTVIENASLKPQALESRLLLFPLFFFFFCSLPFQNSAHRTQSVLEVFKPFFRGTFAIKGLPSDRQP